MVTAGQPWSRLNLLPSEALRHATHVRRLQFRSGEPPSGWVQKHRGWCGVRWEMQPKAIEVVGWYISSTTP